MRLIFNKMIAGHLPYWMFTPIFLYVFNGCRLGYGGAVHDYVFYFSNYAEAPETIAAVPSSLIATQTQCNSKPIS